MKNSKTRKLTGTAMLIAMVIVLQILANYVTIGAVSITLSLIPIVVGACIYGKKTGAILGAVMGCITIIAPSTLAIFFKYNPLGTIITCLVKSTAAGFLSGLFFEMLEKKNPKVGSILASISMPIINTGLFIVGSIIFFKPLVESFNTEGANFYYFLFFGFIGFNFIIEFLTNAILSIVVYQVYLYAHRKHSNHQENNE